MLVTLPTSPLAIGLAGCTVVSTLLDDPLADLRANTYLKTADIPIVFGTHYQFRGNSTELEWQTSFAMQCKFCGLRCKNKKEVEADHCPIKNTTAMWVSFAANSSAQPHDHLG